MLAGLSPANLVKRLKADGFRLRGVDLKYPQFDETAADDFVIGDLREQTVCRGVVDRRFDEIYQLAADMGGAGYIFTGENDAQVLHNSATINLNMLDALSKRDCQLAEMAMDIAGKRLPLRHVPGPLGVRGRNSDNELISGSLGWEPTQPLRAGMEKTYAWIASQVAQASGRGSAAA